MAVLTREVMEQLSEDSGEGAQMKAAVLPFFTYCFSRKIIYMSQLVSNAVLKNPEY